MTNAGPRCKILRLVNIECQEIVISIPVGHVCNDGHERPDVVESRVKFLRTMTECGFLRTDNAPTEEAAQVLPADVPHMSKEDGKKHIV